MTIANCFTLVRLALVPAIYILAAKGYALEATVVFVLAALTDTVDGYLARRLGQVSELGKLLDPIADKLLILSVMYLVVTNGFAPLWLMLLLLAKEAALVLGGLVLLGKGRVIAARFYGKAGSVLLFIALGGGLAGFTWLRPLLYIGVAFSLLSGLDYLLLALRHSIHKNV